MIPTFPTPPPFFPALVSLVRPHCGRGAEAVCVAALEAWEACTGSFPSALEGRERDEAFYWVEQAERIASLGSEPFAPLEPTIYRDGAEIAPEDVPPAVALLMGAEIAEGAGMGSLCIGGTVWSWD